MGGVTQRTRDGVNIGRIERLLGSMGADIRDGGKHAKVATYRGYPFSCAIGPSTDCKAHVIHWMKNAFKESYNPTYINSELHIRYA